MSCELPDFLPGEFSLTRGTIQDYAALEHFHYVSKRPATWAGIWAVRYTPDGSPARPVAVGVLSYPVPSCRAREAALGRIGIGRNENLVFANQHVRTISRVIVHPQFRALGLSTLLVRCLCAHCDTRYIESMAVMARAHPFFERAGMRRFDAVGRGPVYFLLDRQEKNLRRLI